MQEPSFKEDSRIKVPSENPAGNYHAEMVAKLPFKSQESQESQVWNLLT